MFRMSLYLVLFTIEIGGVTVPNFVSCAVEYLNARNLNTRNARSECDIKISSEITKFSDKIRDRSRANFDNLENPEFVAHERCIITST